MSLRIFLFLCACWFGLDSCKKPTLDDSELAPEDELNVRFTDTLTLWTSIVREENISVKNAIYKALGAMDDPVFGKTFASFYLQFELDESPLDFGDNPVLDSIVLTLRYLDSYGDVTVPQTILAYEMLESIDGEEEYFSDQTFNIDPVTVGNLPNFVADLNSDVVIGEDSLPPHLRIKLDDDLGEGIINAASSLENQDDFEEVLKGLYVTADTSIPGKGLIQFDPFSPYSNLSIYYHNSDDTTQKDFPIYIDLNNLGSISINKTVSNFRHNYQGSIVEPYLNSQSSIGDSMAFLQPLAGLNVKFILPYLKNLGNILINKAVLEVTEINLFGTDTFYTTPAELSLRPANDDGTLDVSSLILSENEKNSVLNNTGETVDRYEITYSVYAQRVLDKVQYGNTDFGIFILPLSRQNALQHLVMGGGSHSKYRMKLNLTYTVID